MLSFLSACSRNGTFQNLRNGKGLREYLLQKTTHSHFTEDKTEAGKIKWHPKLLPSVVVKYH